MKIGFRFMITNFNPRSRVGNDGGIMDLVGRYANISIHVPAWGTTDDIVITGIKVTFQSTFPRGERPTFVVTVFHMFLFQSTFPRGERPTSESIERYSRYISIHVPAWGTTANFHKYSLLFYAINIIFLLFIIPSLFSLVLFVLLF